MKKYNRKKPPLLARRPLAIAIAGALSLGASVGANAGITLGNDIFVDNGVVNIASDGNCSLVEAIENSNADTQIHADCIGGAGLDTVHLPNNGNFTLTSVNNTIDGYNNGLPVISDYLIMEGNNSTITRSSASDFRIFHIQSGFVGMGLNLSNGSLPGGDPSASVGGALFNDGSTVRLIDSTISGSSAESGGAIRNEGGMYIYDSTISGNTANGYGGGISSTNNLYIYNSDVLNNMAGVYGGGISTSGDLDINDNSTIADNSASSGGGIHGGSSLTVTITNSVVSSNDANEGGGIYLIGVNSDLNVSSSQISGNTATSSGTGGGGGVFSYSVGGTLSFTETTVSGNNAPSGSGGGVNARNVTINLTRSTVSGNSANNGGGVFLYGGGGSSLVDSTISGNTASSQGGGVFAQSHNAYAYNNTFANNTAPSGDGIYQSSTGLLALDHSIVSNSTCSATVTDLGNNFFTETSCSGSASIGSLNLGALADNGGPTKTHALLSGSVAIDGGGTACAGGGIDQRGNSRPLGNCDIGSVEFQPPEIEVLDATGSAIADGAGSVDFGVTTAGVPELLTFTIQNIGDNDLNLSGLVLPSGFSVSTNFSSPVPGNSSTELTIQADASAEGTFDGTLQFTTDDSDENPFDFFITVEVGPAIAPRTLNAQINGNGSLVSNPEGINCPDDCTEDYANTTLVSLFATPDTGWAFDSWGGNCANSPSTTSADVVMTADRDCSVTFIQIDDNDGVAAAIESAAPNGGDGNGDGVLDSIQDHVVSLPGVSGDYLTLVVDETCLPQSVSAASEASQGETDAGFFYPEGLISFALNCSQTGVEVLFHGLSDADNLVYRKYGPVMPGIFSSADWYTFNSSVGTTQINGNTVVRAAFTLEDGLLGDDTGFDGQIVDAGGVAENPGFVGFSNNTFNVDESAGTVDITVTREGGSQGALSIDYATTDNTALAGVDYDAASGTLNWAAGESGDKTFNVTILDDSEDESNETVALSLGNLSQSGSDIAIDTALLTIVDDDATVSTTDPAPETAGSISIAGLSSIPGIVENDTRFISVIEDFGERQIQLQRQNGSSGEVSIDYILLPPTDPESPVEGDDFNFTIGGTVTWADGETGVKTIPLEIIDDPLTETSETLFVQLENATNGAIIDSPDTLAVTIIDNDVVPGCSGTVGAAFNPDGERVATSACFFNVLDGDVTEIPFQLEQSSSYMTALRMQPDSRHRGQVANILIAATYTPPGGEMTLLAKNASLQWIFWDGLFSSLPLGNGNRVRALPGSLEVILFSGALQNLPGRYELWTGYRLLDGTFVFNGNAPQIWNVQ